MCEGIPLLLEDVFNLEGKALVTERLWLLTEKEIIRWGASHDKKKLLGLARGNDHCAVMLTISDKEVKGLIFKEYSLSVIGIGPYNSYSYNETHNPQYTRPTPIANLFDLIIASMLDHKNPPS